MIRFTLVLMLVSATAYGQSAGAQAESLFRQGREQMAAGKTAEACTSFEASQKLDPQITTLLNLAGCREKNAQYASAWGLFLEAERQTRSAGDTATKQLHDVAKTRSDKLEPRVSKLTINGPASNNVDGLVIMRGKDTVDSMMWNRALPIDGGTYTISVKAPGTTAWTTTVTVGAEADTKTVDVPDLKTLPRDITPVKPEAPTAEQEEQHEVPETHARPSKVVPIAVGVGGVALLGGALTFEILGRANYDDAKAETMDQSKRDSLYDSANTKRYVAQGFAVAGVACVGVAVWLYLRGDSGSSTTTTASKQLIVSPNGIALMGAF
jgi:hypothetical protein